MWRRFRQISKPGIERWPTRGTYLAAIVALCCGPAMLWRFPAMALKHGGGTFLVAYAAAILVTAAPMVVLEIALGQRTQRAAPRAFRAMHKRWEWIGWTGVLIGFSLAVMQMLLAAWSFVIGGEAFGSLMGSAEKLPWEDNPAVYFFQAMLGTTAPDPWQIPTLALIFTLIGAWLLVGLVAASGPRTLGTVLRITFAIALLFFAIFVGRHLLFLSDSDLGAVHGLAWALDLQPMEFGSIDLWIEAFGHALLALGLGTGAHVILAAYLPREADVANNGTFAAVAGCAMTFVAYLAVACLLGSLALKDGRLVSDVTAPLRDRSPDGVGLTMLVYPQALLTAETAWAGAGTMRAAWAAALFFAIGSFALIGSAILLHAGIAALREKFARSRLQLGLFVTLGGLLLTLGLAGLGGWRWFDFFDAVIVHIGLLVVGLLEVICLGWVGSTADLRAHINRVSEVKMGLTWVLLVRIFSPLILTFLLVNALMNVAR